MNLRRILIEPGVRETVIFYTVSVIICSRKVSVGVCENLYSPTTSTFKQKRS